MKKTMLLLATVAVMMGLTACGDDEPNDKQTIDVQKGVIYSVHQSETELYYNFSIDEETGKGSIDVFNVVFRIGEQTSPAMTIRIPDAKFTRKGDVITFDDTDIAPMMYRGSGFVPMGDPAYNVTNLKSVIDLKARSFTISFNCHGGSFSDSGKIYLWQDMDF